MIKINVMEGESSCSIIVKGHAGYAPKGKDVLCAAISTLYQTFHLYILTETTAFIESRETGRDESTLIVTLMKDDAKAAYKMLMTGFNAIAHDYPDYVQVNID